MEDKRTIKTVAAIRKAFCDLIIEGNKSFTIKDIAEKANINRKTFYLHYGSIEDLYKDLEENTENSLMAILNSKGFFNNAFSVKTFIDSFLELMETNPILYEKLLVDDGYKFVFRQIKNNLIKMAKQLNQTFDQLELEIELEYVFSGLVKIFRVWNGRKSEMPKDKMVEIAINLVVFGLSKTLINIS